jgi:hypothetical protein
MERVGAGVAAGRGEVPGGRFAQWKAVLRAGGEIDSVGLNYLEKNLAPVVDDVVVQPGRAGAGEYAAPAEQYGAGELPCPGECGGRAGCLSGRECAIR